MWLMFAWIFSLWLQVAAYFEEAIAAGAPPSRAAQWLLNEIAGWRNNNRMETAEDADSLHAREKRVHPLFLSPPAKPSAHAPDVFEGTGEAEATDSVRAVPLRCLKLT